jgi:2-succinyl-6-hydroxy-2,4-cyclohexadiene-1-carboxylate synthase
VIWALHGFLGRGADWNELRSACATESLPALHTPDLFAAPPAHRSLAAWGDHFAAWVAETDPSPVLLGYSLGGRLALHALLARPTLWRGAVIVSTHPGLTDPAERAARRADDARWAERFLHEDWDMVLADWDAQAVFGGAKRTLERPASAYDRTALATALLDWSLGVQEPLAERLNGIPCPVLWVAGVRDARYVQLGRDAMAQLPRGELRIAPNAGHRVPWEGPAWFAGQVEEFVRVACSV